MSAPDVHAPIAAPLDCADAQPQRARSARAGRAAIMIAVGIAGLLGAAWGSPIVMQMIGEGDFPFHLAAAEQFASDARITVPHFLLQVLLGTLLSASWFASVEQAAVVLFTGLYAATASLMCWYIGRGAESIATLGASVILAIAALVAAPILPDGEPGLYLIGYFPPNAFHNPTMLMAKPLLIVVFACAVASVTRTGQPSWRELSLSAVPVILLGAAKPNYLGCVIPVVIVIAVWKHAAKRDISLARVAAICVPAMLTLGAGYALYRSQPLGEGGVIVAPMRVVALYAPVDPQSIARYVGASVAFPLAVVALWPRATWRMASIRLAWATAIVGLLISYLLAEDGPRLDHGNFLWTGQMAVFVLFVVTAMFLNRQLLPAARSGWTAARVLLTAGVLCLHVESGVRHVLTRVDSLRWLAFWT